MSDAWIANDGSVQAICDGCGDISPAWPIEEVREDLSDEDAMAEKVCRMNVWLAARGWMVRGKDVRCPDCDAP